MQECTENGYCVLCLAAKREEKYTSAVKITVRKLKVESVKWTTQNTEKIPEANDH